MSGVYVKSVVPDSPAAQSQKLRTGDRILAVNGVSLVGMDYSRWVEPDPPSERRPAADVTPPLSSFSGRELIRSAGDRLRLLVAKMESRSGGRSSNTTPC